VRASRTSLVLAGAIGLGGGAGFVLSHAFREPALRHAVERMRGLERETDSLRAERDRLSGELRRRDGLIAELSALLEKERARQDLSAETSAESQETGKSTSHSRESRIPALRSAEEADALFDEAIERSDALALMDLGAALLAMGEPGYEKLIALFDRFHGRIEKDEGKDFLHWQDQLYVGPLARAMADSHTDLLRFGLYLHEKAPESLSGEAKKLQKLLTEDDLSSMLYGYYGGGDPEIDGGYTELYRRQLESEPTTHAIRGLAQIPGDEATDALVACLRRAPRNVLKELVVALAYRGDRRVRPALEELRAGSLGEELDPGTAALIDAAVRSMR